MSAPDPFERSVVAWLESMEGTEPPELWHRAVERARGSGQRPAWLARADLAAGLDRLPNVSAPALAAIVVAALLAVTAIGLLAGGHVERPRLGVTPTALPESSIAVAPLETQLAPAVAPGTWQPILAAKLPGTELTATTLLDGRVLVAGPAAFLFDPATGLWTEVDSPSEPRRGAATTRLADGRVLMAGGVAVGGDRSPLASAELFDPSTGHWLAAGSMTAPRADGHTATTLLDGRVLVAAGTELDIGSQLDAAVVGAVASAELFDPRTGRWTAAGMLNESRSGHTATLLEDGRVLVTGGRIVPMLAMSDAELFDPMSGSWTRAASLSTERFEHAAVRLDDGSVLVIGGHLALADDGPAASAERYDPATDTWSPAGSMALGRYRATAVRLADGTVLVAGGSSPSGPTNTADRYDPSANAWAPTLPMAAARAGQAAVLLEDASVLVVGGTLNPAAAERFVPAAP